MSSSHRRQSTSRDHSSSSRRRRTEAIETLTSARRVARRDESNGSSRSRSTRPHEATNNDPNFSRGPTVGRRRSRGEAQIDDLLMADYRQSRSASGPQRGRRRRNSNRASRSRSTRNRQERGNDPNFSTGDIPGRRRAPGEARLDTTLMGNPTPHYITQKERLEAEYAIEVALFGSDSERARQIREYQNSERQRVSLIQEKLRDAMRRNN